MKISLISVPVLLLAGSILPAQAAEPCPWEDTEHAVVCDQWQQLQQRLEAVEARARSAEQSLQSMQGALESMEQTLQALGETPPASDMPTDPETRRVRTLLDTALNALARQLGMDPAVQLDIQRDYPLVKDGDVYRATFEPAALVIDSLRLDLTPLQVSMRLPDDERVDIAVELPDPLTLRDGENTLSQLGIGNQQLTGAWSESLNSFTDLRIDLQDLTLSVTDMPLSATLGRLASSQTLSVDAAEDWAQNQTFALSDLRLAMEGNAVTLAGIDSELTISGRSYRRLRQLAEELQQIGDRSMEMMTEPPIDIVRQLGELFGTIDDYRFHLEGSELEVREESQLMGRIGRLALGSELDREADGSRVGMRVELTGAATPMAPLPPDLTPDRLRLDIALANIPPDLIERIVAIVEQGAELDPSEQELYWQQQMFGLLMNSGLELRISDSYLAAPEARGDLDLRAAIDPQAAMGGAGELMLRIVGLERLIEVTGGQDNPAAAGLSMVMAFSNRIEEDGRMVDVFDLRFTTDGKLMLNNKDVTAMFMPGAQ